MEGKQQPHSFSCSGGQGRGLSHPVAFLLAHWGGVGRHPDPPPLLVLTGLLPDSLGQLRVVLHKEKQTFSCKPFLPSELESQRQ